MTAKAKYPIKICNVLVPKGATGEIIVEPTTRIKETFPNLQYKKNGVLVLIKFENVLECLVHKDQLIYE